jgi:SAM-dependent methyltransferase
VAYGATAQLYDRLQADMPYAEWQAFLLACIEQSGLAKVRTLLDLGCGTGNLAIPLAQSGYAVTGIDLSSDMLAIAHAKAEAIGLTRVSGDAGGTLRLLEQNMCTFELEPGETVDVAYSFCDSINYVTDEAEIGALFETLQRHLRPGGLLVFDVLTDAQFRDYADRAPFTHTEHDLAFIWTCEYENRFMTHDLTIFYAAEVATKTPTTTTTASAEPEKLTYKRIDEWHEQRAYDLQWLRAALEQRGFCHVHVYGDFTFAAADERTRRAFFTARRAF